MDKWLTLDKVALELKETEREVLSLASSNAIKLSWQPRYVVELYHIDYSDWDDSYGPKTVIRSGFFEIDLTLCPDWKVPLNDIKLGGKGYDLVFDTIEPLAVREIGPDGYIWSVTPPPELDTGKELNFPTMLTLGVFQKELERYKKQLAIATPYMGRELLLPKQQNAIIDLLETLKIPLDKVPERCKKEIWKRLSERKELFVSKKAFDNTWLSLSDSGQMTTHRNL